MLHPVPQIGQVGPVCNVEDATRALGAKEVARRLQNERDQISGEDGGSRQGVPQAPRREGKH